MSAADQWITLEAERVLYVDRGRDVILCDRDCRGPVTLVLRLSKAAWQTLRGHDEQPSP